MSSIFGQGMDKIIESRLFYPDKQLPQTPTDWGLEFEDRTIATLDGPELHGWFLPGRADRRLSGALLLFNHGNAGNIAHRLDNLARLRQMAPGMDLLIYDYRGYGKSDGRISLAGFEADALAAGIYALALARQRGRSLFIFGRSLGGAAAVLQASDNSPVGSAVAGLILESTFTSLAEMAAFHFPLPGLKSAIGLRLDSAARIGTVKAPILFFHGDGDDIVPFSLGRGLYEAAPRPKEFITLTGAGHNDTYFIAGQKYWNELFQFISKLIPAGGRVEKVSIRDII